MSEERKILFVCTGNTCRSFMAETIARDYIARIKPETKIQIASAGTGCLPGEPASSKAVTVLQEMGLSKEDHRTTCLTETLVTEADLVLTMTESQQQFIRRMVPQARDKVWRLSQYALGAEDGAEGIKDILDPFGCELEVYRACAQELSDLVARALNRFLAQEGSTDASSGNT